MPQTPGIPHLIVSAGPLGLFILLFIAALGIGAPIPATALLLTVGALSHAPGGPSFPALAIAGILGACGGHLGDYWVGRLGGEFVNRWLARLRQGATLDSTLQWVLRLRGGRAALVFVSRILLTPIASPISLLAGMTRMPFASYLGIEAAGEAIYVLGNLALGRALGPGLLRGGLALPLFWLAIALLTLLPVGLMRLAARLARGPQRSWLVEAEKAPVGGLVPADHHRATCGEEDANSRFGSPSVPEMRHAMTVRRGTATDGPRTGGTRTIIARRARALAHVTSVKARAGDVRDG
jgi:membrane protein DedA with SNARE-associated domain